MDNKKNAQISGVGNWRNPTHLLLLASVLAAAPLLTMQLETLWRRPYLRFFPLAWLLVAIYLWRIPRVGFAVSPVRRTISIALYSIGLLAELVGAVLVSPNATELGFLLLLTGWILTTLGIVP